VTSTVFYRFSLIKLVQGKKGREEGERRKEREEKKEMGRDEGELNWLVYAIRIAIRRANPSQSIK
jgi:hypothetical protein